MNHKPPARLARGAGLASTASLLSQKFGDRVDRAVDFEINALASRSTNHNYKG
jgi:hypothetical protein